MSNATKSAKTTGVEAEEAESEPVISVGDYDGVAPGPRLKLRYNAELRDQIQTALGLENVMEVPRLTKIVVNVGAGAAIDQKALIERVIGDLTIITGQKPIVTKAKKSIAGFKLREGMPIGAMVTLRKAHMWEFLDRVIAVALPRVRDFKGVSDKAFDGRGNYTLGVKEQIIFPEIEYDRVDKIRGMNISIVTTAKDDVQGKALLEALGLPMWRRGQA